MKQCPKLKLVNLDQRLSNKVVSKTLHKKATLCDSSCSDVSDSPLNPHLSMPLVQSSSFVQYSQLAGEVDVQPADGPSPPGCVALTRSQIGDPLMVQVAFISL